LEQRLVEHPFGHEPLEALPLDVPLADAAGVINLRGLMVFPPPMVPGLGAADLAAAVRDREALGQVTVGFAQEALDLVYGPALAPESLLDISYPYLRPLQRLDQILGSRPDRHTSRLSCQ